MVCGFADSLTTMIIGRVGQGFTGGALIPTAMTIIATRLPRHQQPIGNARYTDGFEIETVNLPGARTRGYGVVNAAFRWNKLLGMGMSAEIYADNLLNKNYQIGGFGILTALGVAIEQRGAPRVIGVSLNVPFGEGR
jgi:MFS family permease